VVEHPFKVPEGFCPYGSKYININEVYDMKIEYDALKKETVQFLNEHKILFLATGADNRITARAVSCVYAGLEIYFQTANDSVKFAQISKNPNVALCAGNMQIEGVATIGQHPLDLTSEQFITLYKKEHFGSFKTYSHLKRNIVIRIDPTLVTFWKYDDEGQPYREFLYVGENRAEREYYDISD
jgi:hypothetical protein